MHRNRHCRPRLPYTGRLMHACRLWVALCTAAALVWSAPTRAGEPNWPDHLAIATASPGGTYYVYGEAVARILTRSLNLPTIRLATEGPAQNIEMLEAREAKLGFVTMGIALQAWNATGAWTGKKPARSLRAIFPMYDTPFHMLVLQDSGIRAVAEIAGKRVGVGPRGGTSAAYFPEFFKTLRIDPTLVFGEWEDLAAQMQRREIDVLAVAAGVPFPSFAALEAKEKVRYVAFAPSEIAALRLAMPELTSTRIPAGTYPSLRRDHQTVGLFNFAVAHASLPDDLVYNVVKAVFDNHGELMEAHAAAASTIPANVDRNSFLPLHPGAIRYYWQIGRAGQTD
jgi:TRAP transporter TAXI family solute receptor